MPVYEFYCGQCNKIYKFFSRTVNTEKIPDCPGCKNVKLKRQISLFAALSGKPEGSDDEGMPPIDEARMERAMSIVAQEADTVNEDDPRQAASLMRKFSDMTGLKMGSGMEEALHRLEKGEDPEQIEQDLGDVLEGEDPFRFEGTSKNRSGKGSPEVDENLYEL